VQSLPFLSATLLALFEDTAANDFSFWRNLQTRLQDLVRRRPSAIATIAKANAIAETIAQAPAQAADKSSMPAQ
jgi:hypothetical protein